MGKHEPRKLCLFSHAGYPPMSSDQNEILHGGWSSGGSPAKFKFHQNRLSAFGAVGVKICCLPMTWPNQWENGQISGKTAKSMAKSKFRHPTTPKLLTILIKFEPQNYLLKTSHHAKFHFDPTTWVDTQHD